MDYEAFYDKLAKVGGDQWQARMYRAPHQRVRREKIKELLAPYLPNAHVLEVGCANGLFTVWLNTKARYIIAVEISSEALKRAPKLNNVTWCRSDIAKYCDRIIDTGCPKFDVIIAEEVLEHLENPQAQMDQFRKILKPGGIILIGVPISETRNPDAFDVRLLGKEIKPGDATGHLHAHRPNIWKPMFKEIINEWTNGISWVGLGR